MTSEEAKFNYWTHGTGSSRRNHTWRYLGRAVQGYHCTECDLRVTKAELKRNTDA